MPGIASAPRAARRGGRRIADAAMRRYRDAVATRSTRLPAYLVAVDAADLAVRVRRRGRSPAPWNTPAPIAPSVAAAALSSDDELSFVLTGASSWRRTVTGVALDRDDNRTALPDAVVQAAAGAIRISVRLPEDAGTAGGASIVLLDEDGEPLDLPTPRLDDLAEPRG